MGFAEVGVGVFLVMNSGLAASLAFHVAAFNVKLLLIICPEIR